jgi:membrane-bound lytic murein transglycosylase B
LIPEPSRLAVALLLVALSTGDTAWAAPHRHRKSARTRQPVVETYAGRPEIAVFAQQLAKLGLDPAYVSATLRQAHKLESVRKAIKLPPAGVRRDWRTYRRRFVDEQHIRAGVRFWNDNEAALVRASTDYGVPEAVILGILGVETQFGQNSGRYRVLDALATLAFDFPQGAKDRSAYFRAELAEFLVWCARSRCTPRAVYGSYAGAVGMPQFMPDNIVRFGVDLDGDGRVDLQSPADAIGSVARFLALHGWVRDLLPCIAVNVNHARLATLLKPDIVPSFDDGRLQALGAEPLAPLPEAERFALVELQNGGAPSEYFLGSRNFFVLTRYNRSAYYAKAVLELGQAVAEARGQERMAALRLQPEAPR